MYRSVGNKKQVMLMRREFLYIFFYFHFNAIFLRINQSGFKLFGINGILETEIHKCSRLAVENIISFVLRKIFSEMFFGIGRPRMALNRKVTSIKCVEKIKTDRKFRSKSLRRLTEQFFIIQVKQKIKRDFEQIICSFYDNTIFGSNQFKRPRIVYFILL